MIETILLAWVTTIAVITAGIAVVHGFFRLLGKDWHEDDPLP